MSTITTKSHRIGDAVEFTADLGAVQRGEAKTAKHFVAKVSKGERGVFVGTFRPGLSHNEWLIVQFGAWDVPCHPSHVKPVEPGPKE